VNGRTLRQTYQRESEARLLIKRQRATWYWRSYGSGRWCAIAIAFLLPLAVRVLPPAFADELAGGGWPLKRSWPSRFLCADFGQEPYHTLVLVSNTKIGETG
jgi:hypothetical protein